MATGDGKPPSLDADIDMGDLASLDAPASSPAAPSARFRPRAKGKPKPKPKHKPEPEPKPEAEPPTAVAAPPEDGVDAMEVDGAERPAEVEAGASREARSPKSMSASRDGGFPSPVAMAYAAAAPLGFRGEVVWIVKLAF